MTARIYRPSKNAMQSGRANNRTWVLEFAPSSARSADPLMGWTSAAETQTQVKLRFQSLNHAKNYAEKHGIDYVVIAAQERTPKRKSYAENFRFQLPG
ncbi:MAG: ETC complex I subunit [Alphaproteobacteria bacterium]